MPPYLRLPPRIHGSWTRRWWGGDPALGTLFGAPPAPASLAAAADSVDSRDHGDWRALLDPGPPVPERALVVLAGQQPVLAGGPLLLAHKAATAIALAGDLAERWQRPVVPVFLLATEDHDTSEIDHVDVIDQSNGTLIRHRVRASPPHEAFFRCHWDGRALETVMAQLSASQIDLRVFSVADDGETPPVADHVARLLERVLGPLGLRVSRSDRLTRRHAGVLARALETHTEHAAALEAGAARLDAAGLPSSFDARDPRPLVLESRGGRRRRIGADDRGAAARLAASPDDFSPHAALRPVVQARALPVIAQVCGPSELLYLAQARALHGLHGAAAPVLVPRLEATRVDAPDVERALELLRDEGQAGATHELARRLDELLRAARGLAAQVRAEVDSLAPRAARWLAATERSSRRLAEAPAWHGRHAAGLRGFVRPRGRYQDAVLAWLPEAARTGNPVRWGRHLVDLARPLEPPDHVVHTFPPEPLDG